jgi:alkanesulfonate monooxygenase SsuD/methylene tetrahydromethanopterin reductase-like flavin-dependent oxidoreductase (luciferase family)
VKNVRLGAERAGRDPAGVGVACYLRVSAGADDATLRHALARELSRYIAMPFYRAMFEAAGFSAGLPAVAEAYPRDPDAAAPLVDEAMLAALTVRGDAAAFRQRAAEYRALGVTEVVVAPVPAGADRVGSWAAAIRLASGPAERSDSVPQTIAAPHRLGDTAG